MSKKHISISSIFSSSIFSSSRDNSNTDNSDMEYLDIFDLSADNSSTDNLDMEYSDLFDSNVEDVYASLIDYSDLFVNCNYENKKRLFTGDVMCGDSIVATVVDNDIQSIVDMKKCPLYLIRTSDFEGWLRTRCIDLHRTNSRVLKKMLRLQNSDEIDLVLRVNAATVTDNYWCREIGSPLMYKDIDLTNGYLADSALLGIFKEVPEMNVNLNTPELTNIGSFEKCWKFDGDSWFMLKKADRLQGFSELFVYGLGKKLGYDMAECKNHSDDNNDICSKDFTKSIYNLEPIHSLVGDNVDCGVVANVLNKLGSDFVKDYLKIIFMDALVMNPDRHEFNLGLLRDRSTGEIVKLAPNFDNNLSLISRGYPKSMLTKNNVMIKDFIEIAKQYPNDFQLPEITSKLIKSICFDVFSGDGDYAFNIEYKFITDFVLNNYELIKEGLKGEGEESLKEECRPNS